MGWILTNANHGFDLSDESFYLSWTEGPRDYPVSVTQFGFVHSLIFAVLRDDVVLFRQFNILTTYALTIVVAYQLLGERLRSLGSGVISTFAIVSAFALPSLKVMNYWLFTPSYNSLNGMAFLLVCIGIFSKADTDGKQSRAALMIGVGGCLSFLAKPTAALVLGVMVLIFVWGVRKWALKSLAVAVCTAVVILLFSMFWIGGGPISFVAELRETLAIATDPSHSFGRLIRWDSPHMNGGVRIVFIVVSMLLVAFLRFRKGSPSESVVRFSGQFFSVAFLALGAIAIASAWLEFRGVSLEFLKHSDDAEASKERYLLLSTLSLALIAGRWGEIDRPKLATAFFLFWLPYAYAFGTNINYWDKGASVAFFWVLSFGVLMTALPARRCQFFMFLMIASLLPILSVLDLETSYTQPYLQKPLNQVSLASVRVGRGDTELLVSEKTADFIRVWRRSAAEAGFRKGAPVIDLSGQGNGLIYLLGGHCFPAIWSSAGTPAGEQIIRGQLQQRGPQGLEDLWVLKRENSERSNPDAVLEEVGLSISDFVDVVRIPISASPGDVAPRLLSEEDAEVWLVLLKRKSTAPATEPLPEEPLPEEPLPEEPLPEDASAFPKTEGL